MIFVTRARSIFYVSEPLHQGHRSDFTRKALAQSKQLTRCPQGLNTKSRAASRQMMHSSSSSSAAAPDSEDRFAFLRSIFACLRSFFACSICSSFSSFWHARCTCRQRLGLLPPLQEFIVHKQKEGPSPVALTCRALMLQCRNSNLLASYAALIQLSITAVACSSGRPLPLKHLSATSQRFMKAVHAGLTSAMSRKLMVISANSFDDRVKASRCDISSYAFCNPESQISKLASLFIRSSALILTFYSAIVSYYVRLLVRLADRFTS